MLKTLLKEKDHWRDLYFELVDQDVSQNAKTEKLVKVKTEVKTEKLKEEKVVKKRDLKLKVKTEQKENNNPQSNLWLEFWKEKSRYAKLKGKPLSIKQAGEMWQSLLQGQK